MANKELRSERINEHHYKVFFGNKLIGYAIMDVDGYYYFDHTTQSNGFWNSNSLRMIADLLDDMNKPHDDRIKDHFGKDDIY
jgi:hypothetical protein